MLHYVTTVEIVVTVRGGEVGHMYDNRGTMSFHDGVPTLAH